MSWSAMVVVGSALVFSVPARAQAPLATDPTLDRLIEESLAARPELASARAAVRAQQQRIPQSDALPDPTVQIGVQNDGFTSIEIGSMENSYVSLMASQSFPWPGRRPLSRTVAELSAAEAEQTVARVVLSTEADVRRAYLDLLLVRDRLALLDELERIWQQSFQAASARYETGSGAQSDALRAQLELSRLRQRRLALEANAQTRAQNLNRLRDHPLNEPIETSTHIRDLPALADLPGRFSAEDARARSPELAAAHLALARAKRSAELAERSYYPDIVVSAGLMFRGAMPPMWLVTAGGSVPLFPDRRQRPAIAENRALAAAARADVEAIEQGLGFRAEERRTAFAAAVATIDLYNQGLLAQSEATAESTLTQYEFGRVTFASVLETNGGFIADQEAYLEAVVAAYRLLIADAEVSLGSTAALASGGGFSPGMPGAGSLSAAPSGSGVVSAGGTPSAPGESSSSMSSM